MGTFDLDDDTELVLIHYGTKGMKWGVRKKRPSSSSSSASTSAAVKKAGKAAAKAVSKVRAGAKKAVENTQVDPTEVQVKATPGKRVKTKGGENHKPSDDAIRVAESKQIAKKSTTDALTTKQLQDAVNRMNLEQQYARLNPPKEPFVKGLLKTEGKTLLESVVQDPTQSKEKHISATKTGKVGLIIYDAVKKAKSKKG